MRISAWAFLFALVAASPVSAGTVFVNGGFESGDYSGWTVSQTPEYWVDPSTGMLWDLRPHGTWGICQHGEVLAFNGQAYDFADNMYSQLLSPSLPKTCAASEGFRYAFQLQNAGQTHILAQELTLPKNAETIAWDMFYKNHNTVAPLFRPDQGIRVSLKTTSGQVVETLFRTDSSSPSEISSWKTYASDVSQFAGSTVVFEVEVTTYWQRLDAYFDNFRVVVAESEEPPPVVGEPSPPAASQPFPVPPGWNRAGKTPKGLEKQEKLPEGLFKGDKAGF